MALIPFHVPVGENLDNVKERAVITRLVETALADGWLISVFDGEERTITKSRDAAAIFDALATTDSDTLTFEQAHKRGSVLLIYGNGADVISDYHCAIESESFMINANALANALE